MLEQSQYIYNLLNVASITDLATGGIFPLTAEQDITKLITYKLTVDNKDTKDNRNNYGLVLAMYHNTYDEALEVHDAVHAVLTANNMYLDQADAEYIEETNECAVVAVYNFKK